MVEGVNILGNTDGTCMIAINLNYFLFNYEIILCPYSFVELESYEPPNIFY